MILVSVLVGILVGWVLHEVVDSWHEYLEDKYDQ